MTASTCWPQPRQVTFWQVRQRVAEHISAHLLGRVSSIRPFVSVVLDYTPGGRCKVTTMKLEATGMQQCLTASAAGEDAPMSAAETEKLFLSLA